MTPLKRSASANSSDTSDKVDAKPSPTKRARSSTTKDGVASRLSKAQKEKLMEMAMDVFLAHPNYQAMAAEVSVQYRKREV